LFGSDVSIHAPAWGATWTRPAGPRSTNGFNPRARVGRDVDSEMDGARAACFNPRARVGRDQGVLPLSVGFGSFNPRARVGRDAA